MPTMSIALSCRLHLPACCRPDPTLIQIPDAVAIYNTVDPETMLPSWRITTYSDGKFEVRYIYAELYGISSIIT